MGKLPKKSMEWVSFPNVTITDQFWSKRIEATYLNTLPAILEQLKATGRWDAFSLKWRPGDPDPPHIFWDSDTAKFLEAACYALMKRNNPHLLKEVEQQIEWICESQWEDGYINSYYTLVEPQNCFTNLRDCHELYCAGHLLEAAIAYYQLTGKTTFLNAMTRYITLIQSTFGPKDGQLHGYPGHEELELALMKLFRLTNASEHRDLARYFIEERGQRRNGKHFYELEAEQNGVTLWPGHFKKESWFDYMQAGKPIREQETIEGHAVRAMYFLCGVSEVGLYLNDTSLLTALVRLYKDMVERKMYVTYGIGSVHQWEGFGEPYDLPNDSAYCETCAGIGLVFLCHRLLKWDWTTLIQHGLKPGEIADVMEGALYNVVSGSVSIDGKAFFYVNPLETRGASYQRKDWFDVSCCPPNVARLFSSLGDYVFLTRKTVHESVTRIVLVVVLYMNCTAEIDVDGHKIKVHVETEWPLSGVAKIWFQNAENVQIELRLRIPAWGNEYTPPIAIEEDGFLHLTPQTYGTQTVDIHIPFTPKFIRPHPQAVQNQGCVAVRRGPLIYAMETADNNFVLSDACLDRPGHLEEIISINGIDCKRIYLRGKLDGKPRILKFIPYWSWGNRENSDVLVWVKSQI